MKKQEFEKGYNFGKIEKEIRAFWKKTPKLDSNTNKQAALFTILMPPPNVTGQLHIGHALNNFIQDSLIRFYSLQGRKTVWVPGFDHAGIATEIMVKKWIKTNHWKVEKPTDLTKYFQKWVKIHQDKITIQWEKLGLAINQELTSFTLSPEFSLAVKKAFVQLYKENLVYQAKKLVNFDLSLKTVVSDIEVVYKKNPGKMYYVKYFSPNQKDFLLVATTRPETIFADQALVVHPDDLRYQAWINKQVVNPLTKKTVPVVTSKLITKNLGTGVMKCTPGHDFKDFTINQDYQFKLVSCFDQEGKMNDLGQEFKGLDRLKARPLVVKKLLREKLLLKTEKIVHQLPFSLKTDSLIEPMLSEQWFIKTKDWAKNLLTKTKEINFIPNKFKKQFLKWLENCQDWCISRQLSWGHKLPIYFNQQKKLLVTVTKPVEKTWIQSQDVLDTWFSSGLWSLINTGWNNKTRANLSQTLPINYLVTSYDIIFFWVTRMLFLHHHFQKSLPFQKILIHGLIRTSNYQKMSKSKGNVINPEEIIAKYGGDSLRFYLLANHKIGEDLFFQEKKLVQAYQFCNKIWNINHFINLYPNDQEKFNINDCQEELNIYIVNKFTTVMNNHHSNFKKHLWSVAIQQLTDFIWKDFSNFYLLLAKKCLNSSWETKKTMHWIWKQILLVLHPYLPFLTQYLWNQNFFKTNILNQKWMAISKIKAKKWPILEKVIFIKTKLKTLTFKKQWQKLQILTPQPTFWKNNLKKLNLFLEPWKSEIKTIEKAKLEKVLLIEEIMTPEIVYKEIVFLKKELQRSEKLLNNAQFINKARVDIVSEEKNKVDKNRQKLQKLQTIYQKLLKTK